MSGTPSVNSYGILGDSEKARFRNTNKSRPTGLRQRSRTQFIKDRILRCEAFTPTPVAPLQGSGRSRPAQYGTRGEANLGNGSNVDHTNALRLVVSRHPGKDLK
jgi:hypothetical protein